MHATFKRDFAIVSHWPTNKIAKNLRGAYFYGPETVMEQLFSRSSLHEIDETVQRRQLLATAQERYICRGRRAISRNPLSVTPEPHTNATALSLNRRAAAIISDQSVETRTLQGHSKKTTTIEPITETKLVCRH